MTANTVTKALRKLYKSVTGEETNKISPTKIISDLADNYSGGGGGGSAEPLVCTYNSSTGYLDKTYGEIKTAALSGKSVYLKDNVKTEGVYRLQNLLSYETYESEGDEPTFSGAVTFSGGSLITSEASSVSALDAEYPFYGD